MARLKECPKCGSGLLTLWRKGRMLRQECRDDGFEECGWMGEPFQPEKKPIRTVQKVPSLSGGWEFEGFDQYGHIYVSSVGHASKRACRKAARASIEEASKNPNYGRCTAVLWPPIAIRRGFRVR